MEEIWKSVPSYPGVMASNLGRVLMPETSALMPNGIRRAYRTKPRIGSIARSAADASHVYRKIWSRRFGNLKVHGLVCEAFHGRRPFPGAVIIHRDENGLNNREENLCWGTQKENLNMPKIKQYHRSRVGDKNPRRASILRKAA